MALNFHKNSSVATSLQRTVALGIGDGPIQPEQCLPASGVDMEVANGGSVAKGSKSDDFVLYKSDSQRKREKKNARKAQQAKRLAEHPVVIDGIKGLQGMANLVKEIDRVAKGVRYYGAPRLLAKGGVRIHCACESDQKRLLDRSKWPVDAFGGDAWPHLPGVRSNRPATSPRAHAFKAVTYSVPDGFSDAELEAAFCVKTQKMPSKNGGFIYLFLFDSAELRDKAVKSGLFLYGMKLSFRVFHEERALQCRVCLQFGHLEISCPSLVAICPRCGNPAHDSGSVCPVAKPASGPDSVDKLYCVNCKSHGHGSFYGGCPHRKSYLAAAKEASKKEKPQQQQQQQQQQQPVVPVPAQPVAPVVAEPAPPLEDLKKEMAKMVQVAMQTMVLGVMTALSEWSASGKGSDPMVRVAEVLRTTVSSYGVDPSVFDSFSRKSKVERKKKPLVQSTKATSGNKRKTSSDAEKSKLAKQSSSVPLSASQFVKAQP